MLRRSGLHLLPGLRCAVAACSQAACGAPSVCQGATVLAPWPAGPQPALDVCWQQQWQLGSARTACSSGSSSSVSDSGDRTRGRRCSGRPSRTAEAQPELQAWLEQHGLPAAEAEEHARRLVAVFGGDQQAVLASLPATFERCRGQGLTVLETAQLLDRIAFKRHENVVNFETMAWRVWQLMDGPITAFVQQRRQQPNMRQPKHSSLAGVLRSSRAAAQSLGTAPGHAEAWLAAVGKQLPHADLGRLLLTNPAVVAGSVNTVLAAITWLVDTLKIEEEDLAAFVAANPTLLTAPLEANFKKLQQTLQLPAEHLRPLVLKSPSILTASSQTVHAAASWLGQLFNDAEQLLALVQLCPELLAAPTDRLQRNASYLQRELEWQPGSGELAAFIDDYAHPFAQLDFEGEETQAKLLLFTGVVGAERRDALRMWSNYLYSGLETTAARYRLVQERAPWLLFNASGGASLAWVAAPIGYLTNHGVASLAEARAFVRTWRKSEEGKRLLAAIRSGSTEGWPLPGLSPDEAVEQRKRAAAELKSRKAAARQAARAWLAAAEP